MPNPKVVPVELEPDFVALCKTVMHINDGAELCMRGYYLLHFKLYFICFILRYKYVEATHIQANIGDNSRSSRSQRFEF